MMKKILVATPFDGSETALRAWVASGINQSRLAAIMVVNVVGTLRLLSLPKTTKSCGKAEMAAKNGSDSAISLQKGIFTDKLGLRYRIYRLIR